MRTPDEMKQAMQWLVGDDTGMSSVAICNAACGIEGDNSHPHDPDDIGRCFRLINKLPWAWEGVTVLAGRSPVWSVLAEHWDELFDLMDSEVGIDWSKGDKANKTYARMKELMT